MSKWLESFVSRDSSVWRSVSQSSDIDAIWEQLAFIVDAALFGYDLNPPVPDTPVSQDKVEPPSDQSLFNVLGVFEGEDSKGTCVKVRNPIGFT